MTDTRVKMYDMTFSMETLDKYMSSEVPFISSVSLSDTKGERCDHTYKGGFKIKGVYDYVYYDLERDLRPALEETVDEVLISHYAPLWKSFLIILEEGIDASYDCDTVTISFIYNEERSLNEPLQTLTSDFEDGKLMLNMSPHIHNFYDLVINIKNGDNEELVDELKGIPHFLIPAFMKVIGIWIGFSRFWTESDE
ncbi:MAG: hypothetical protein QXF12_00810 [Candidatus Aenigmatarchaeota archaeon]